MSYNVEKWHISFYFFYTLYIYPFYSLQLLTIRMKKGNYVMEKLITNILLSLGIHKTNLGFHYLKKSASSLLSKWGFHAMLYPSLRRSRCILQHHCRQCGPLHPLSCKKMLLLWESQTTWRYCRLYSGQAAYKQRIYRNSISLSWEIV